MDDRFFPLGLSDAREELITVPSTERRTVGILIKTELLLQSTRERTSGRNVEYDQFVNHTRRTQESQIKESDTIAFQV